MRDGLIIETGAMDDGYWAGDENPFHITVIGNGEEKKLKSRVSILARLADIRLCSTGQKNMHFLR